MQVFAILVFWDSKLDMYMEPSHCRTTEGTIYKNYVNGCPCLVRVLGTSLVHELHTSASRRTWKKPLLGHILQVRRMWWVYYEWGHRHVDSVSAEQVWLTTAISVYPHVLHKDHYPTLRLPWNQLNSSIIFRGWYLDRRTFWHLLFLEDFSWLLFFAGPHSMNWDATLFISRAAASSWWSSSEICSFTASFRNLHYLSHSLMWLSLGAFSVLWYILFLRGGGFFSCHPYETPTPT